MLQVGQGDGRQHAMRHVAQFQGLGFAVQRLQAPARVGQADAIKYPRCQRGAFVEDAECQQFALAFGTDAQLAALGALGDAVLDRVFHQRLQDKVRHLGSRKVAGTSMW